MNQPTWNCSRHVSSIKFKKYLATLIYNLNAIAKYNSVFRLENCTEIIFFICFLKYQNYTEGCSDVIGLIGILYISS